MKRRFLLLATPALAFAAPVRAAGAMVDEVKARGVLRSGLSTFVPWAMRDKNGGLIGFELDVARRARPVRRVLGRLGIRPVRVGQLLVAALGAANRGRPTRGARAATPGSWPRLSLTAHVGETRGGAG